MASLIHKSIDVIIRLYAGDIDLFEKYVAKDFKHERYH